MKQNTLWNMSVEEQNKPKITLYPPVPEIQDGCYHMLQRETVPELMPKFQQLKKMLTTHHPVMHTPTRAREGTLPQYILDAMTKKGNPNKEELLKFISFFLSDTQNFYAYINSLEEDVKKVWVLLMENYFASDRLLKRETGKSWFTVDKTYYYSSGRVSISDKLPWFMVLRSETSHYSQNEYYLYIPINYRPYLYRIFFTQKINSYPVQTNLPQEESLQVFNGEKQIFKLMPIMESLYKQNLLQIAKFRISASALNKANKLLNAQEFFPEETDKMVSQLRTFMLLSAYSTYSSMAEETDEPEVFIRKLVRKIIQYPGVLIATLLPHVNGLKQSMLCNCCAPIQALHILQILIIDESDKWQDVDNIRYKLYVLERDGCQNILFKGSTLQNAEFVNLKHNKELILMEDVYLEMGVPFIKGFLLLLASLGVVEVAYGDHDPESTSYSCSLRYVRLTPLGRYVLDLQKVYTPEANEECYFEINADDLIVRSISEDNPYEALLTDIATPIGRHRYKVTFGSFLGNCTSRSDIEEKISFFKRHVCKQPTQNWQDFFNTLLQHCHPLKQVREQKYYIYQLNAEDKELQRLISTDPYLRKYTKRGEDYLLLIETKYLREVINRLRTFGYLL